MNKKLKFAIPFAVLALSCGIAAAGCGGNGEHTHSYTEWAHDETQHWKKCPDDDAIDESSKANHVFVAGECECGAQEKTGPVVQAKYGTVTGKVKLTKNGVQVTDATVLNGITVDMGDDKVEFTPSVADGVYSFTVTKVEVGKPYELSITCTGYESYGTEIMLEEENEVAPIGGENGITLNYEVFTSFWGFDTTLHDFSHINDANPTIGVDGELNDKGEGTKTLNVITTDKYEDVSVTIHAKSANAGPIQGILMQFEDGKAAMFNMHATEGHAQFRAKEWDKLSIFNPEDNNTWVEMPQNTIPAAEIAKFNGDGIDVTLTRKGGTLYSFLDGRFAFSADLPAGYEDDKIQVGLFAFGVKPNAVWSYNITDEVPEMQSVIDIDVTNPADGTECSVTANPKKDAYAFDEEVELTFTAPEGYKLDSLTVGGDNMLNAVKDGKLKIKANKVDLKVVATYVQEEPIALELTVKGKKLGTTAALAADTQVSFKGTDYTFTVGADGKITKDAVSKGTYTVVVDGYFEKEVKFDENLTEIVLENDTFKEILGWGSFDFTKQNEATPEFGITNDCSVIFTNETYGDVKTSIYLKGNNMNAGNGGLLFRFVGEGLAENGETVTVTMQGTKKVQFSEDNLWGQTTVASGCVWNNLYYFIDCNDDDADRTAGANAAKYLEEYAAGTLKFSVIRKGATFYVFLDDALIGQMTVNEKYASAKCEVGFMSANLGNTTEWKSWKIGISDDATLPAVTITDGTAEDANGTIEISEGAKLGDTVTITVNPSTGYILDTLTVSGGVTPTAGSNNTYTFVATEKTYTVTATFKEAPATQAEAAVTGIGLGASAVDMNGKEITFKPAEGAETKLTVANGKVKGIIAAGEYTVSCEGFYDLTATVEENGSFAADTSFAFEKIIFVYNIINEPEYGVNGDGSQKGFIGKVATDGKNVGNSTKAASTGKITAGSKGETAKGIIYEWSQEQYKDVAITVTLKEGNGNQGMIMRFNGEQKDVRLRFENTKAQWIGGGWWWGTHHINDAWDFGNGENYANSMSAALLEKYKTGLKLTLLRKGGIVYALIDGEVYGAQLINDFTDKQARLAVFVENATEGYEIPFEISTDVDAILNAAKDTHNVLSTLGKWTVTDTTLAVTGNGYVEFAPTTETTKESLSVKIASKNNPDKDKKQQGIVYRFADGRWIAARIEHGNNNEGKLESYIQYADDTLIPKSGGSLTGWALVHNLTDAEITAFTGDGIDLKLVRDGKCIYVMLGGNVIDKKVLDDKYAEMDGVIAAMIENSNGTAYAYEYKAGEDVTVPQIYRVDASFDGAANGYAITLDKNLVAKDGKVTLTVHSNPDTLGWGSWSMFPSKITVNGVDTALTVADFVSDGANKLHYTKEFTITDDTEIKITIAKGTAISKGVVVTVKDNVGGTATSDSGEDGYYWNDACTLYITPEEGYEIASITVDGGTPITEGWTFNSNKNRYEYNIADPIQKAIAVVVEFKAATPAE